MLLTKTPRILVPAIFQTRFDELSHDLKKIIGYPFQHENSHIPEDFYFDFCEFISEFYTTIEKKNLTYATKIIEQFYSKWIDSTIFPNKINTAIDYAITTALTSLVMFHLAVQLAYVSHYSLMTSYGLTLLFITVGIKITTPEWVSVGTLSHGLFKCKIIKSRALSKNTCRMLRL